MNISEVLHSIEDGQFLLTATEDLIAAAEGVRRTMKDGEVIIKLTVKPGQIDEDGILTNVEIQAACNNKIPRRKIKKKLLHFTKDTEGNTALQGKDPRQPDLPMEIQTPNQYAKTIKGSTNPQPAENTEFLKSTMPAANDQ